MIELIVVPTKDTKFQDWPKMLLPNAAVQVKIPFAKWHQSANDDNTEG